MPPVRETNSQKHFIGESHHAIKEMVVVAGQKIKKIVTVHMLLIRCYVYSNKLKHKPKPIANSQHSSQPGSGAMLCACPFVGRYFKTPVPAVCM